MVVVGVTRRIDDLGRITIPSEIRKTYQLDKNNPVEIIGTEDGILLSLSVKRRSICICRS